MRRLSVRAAVRGCVCYEAPTARLDCARGAGYLRLRERCLQRFRADVYGVAGAFGITGGLAAGRRDRFAWPAHVSDSHRNEL